MVAMTLPAKPWTNGMMTADGTRMFDSTVGSEGAWRATPVPAGGLPAGSIIQWGSNTAPANWLICDGSAVSRALWPSLFAVIGTTYGSGDGSTTFNLPDLRGRVAVGRDGSQTEFDVLGETGGAKSHSHGTTQLTAAVWAGFWKVRQASTWTATNSGGVTAPGSSSSMSNSGASIEGYTDYNSNLSPYLVTNYIIKATTGWSAGDSELALRMAAAETNASTTNKSGLVPVIPTSVDKGSGTASVGTNGLVTFSGASSISLNGVITPTYTNYLIIHRPASTNSDAMLSFKYRRNGVDESGGLHHGSGNYSYTNGTAGVSTFANSTSQFLGYLNSPGNGQGSGILQILNGSYSKFISEFIGGYSAYGTGKWSLSGTHFGGLSYDGISFIIGAGTLAGTIQVYGYR